MIKSKTKNFLFYCAIILIWQLLYYMGVQILGIWEGYSFPNPVMVCKSLIYLSENGTLFQAIKGSLVRGSIGFSLSVVVGTVLGILIEMNPYFKQNLHTLLLGGQSIPSICWVPFAILWFGLGESTIIFVVFIGSVCSVVLAIRDAIEEVPVLYIKVAKTMGATKKDILLRVILPSALPGFMSGLRQSWSFAWRALMSGEVLYSCNGLGYTLTMGRELADINQVVAVMVVIILIGMLVDRLLFTAICIRKRNNSGF